LFCFYPAFDAYPLILKILNPLKFYMIIVYMSKMPIFLFAIGKNGDMVPFWLTKKAPCPHFSSWLTKKATCPHFSFAI